MHAADGARLLASLWPTIDLALSEENRASRLQFISDLLRTFARNGTDLSDVLNIDEDVTSCAQHLGTLPRQKPPQSVWETDLSGIDDPVEYQLIGGPYDGTVIRLASDLLEMPPGMLTLAPNGQPSRLDGDTRYELELITERDSDGDPTDEYLAYKHKTTVAK